MSNDQLQQSLLLNKSLQELDLPYLHAWPSLQVSVLIQKSVQHFQDSNSSEQLGHEQRNHCRSKQSDLIKHGHLKVMEITALVAAANCLPQRTYCEVILFPKIHHPVIRKPNKCDCRQTREFFQSELSMESLPV